LAAPLGAGYDWRRICCEYGVMRPDKEKVVDEIWDDERVRSFLDKPPLGAEPSKDFSALLYAYRSMRPMDFSRFVDMFLEAGRDLTATNRHDKTLADVIRPHRHAQPFIDILKRHGAA